jgi:glycosyltransferase involved in cell wall biosynthesis
MGATLDAVTGKVLTGTRVAVVVPCFNDGGTLDEALESLEGQEPHELVVVDDGSTDESTLRTLAELRARGVNVVRQANGGLSAARMAGVRATSARYVMPLDADDALGPGALAALADALDHDPEAVMAWGDTEIWGDVELRLRVGRRLDPWQIAHLNVLPVASMIRRAALLEVGGWQLRHGYEDWDLWMAFAERGRDGVYVPHTAHRYRRHGGRMLEGCIPRHDELYGELRKRHPALFASQGRQWLHSRAPFRVRALFPLVAALPLSEYNKSRLYQLSDQPGQFFRMRRLRRRAARTNGALAGETRG